jgi:hypothetical protein
MVIEAICVLQGESRHRRRRLHLMRVGARNEGEYRKMVLVIIWLHERQNMCFFLLERLEERTVSLLSPKTVLQRNERSRMTRQNIISSFSVKTPLLSVSQAELCVCFLQSASGIRPSQCRCRCCRSPTAAFSLQSASTPSSDICR